ncbi:MAG: molybdopterin-guanine dinucleotide biosynthesis protein [Cryobacterium sp.]|nr:molybdopterin-guanine dinucleotide biosynthesis protein [Cryobacterium sp.]
MNDVELDIDHILGLAGEAARAVVRPAAPVTTFLVGFAAGVAIGNGSAPDSAIAGAMETATRSARAQ